jgi:hypothetical protein
VLVSPALQRGESDPAMIEPESRRDGAFSSHAFFQLLRKTEWKSTDRGRLPYMSNTDCRPGRAGGFPGCNNVAERALKRAVLHRKNALFYRTLHGAQVGDLFMSLIHTCQLCGANSFDYLVELQRHARKLAACPAE